MSVAMKCSVLFITCENKILLGSIILNGDYIQVLCLGLPVPKVLKNIYTYTGITCNLKLWRAMLKTLDKYKPGNPWCQWTLELQTCFGDQQGPQTVLEGTRRDCYMASSLAFSVQLGHAPCSPERMLRSPMAAPHWWFQTCCLLVPTQKPVECH